MDKYSLESLTSYTPATKSTDSKLLATIENDIFLPLLKDKSSQKLVLLRLPTALTSKELPSTIFIDTLNAPSENDSLKIQAQRNYIADRCKIKNTMFDQKKDAFRLLIPSSLDDKSESFSFVSGPLLDNIWTFAFDLQLPASWTVNSLQEAFDTYCHKYSTMTQPSGLKFRCFPPGCRLFK